MSKLYIQIEAINIYNNVLDTNQLSVVRGSSFLLKNAIKKVATQLKNELEAISTGASVGLFLVKEQQQLETVLAEIWHLLRADEFAYFTFAVEHCQAKSLTEARELLITKLRFHQLNAIATVPDVLSEALLSLPCELEGRRIAHKNYTHTIQKKKRRLSASVAERYRCGRNLRHHYYFDEITDEAREALDGYGFTDNLESLAKSDQWPRLDNKVAVIYIDGNQFSKSVREYLKLASDELEAQKIFDNSIQSQRAAFLEQTLRDMIDASPVGVNKADTAAKYQETLTADKGKDADGKPVKPLRLETLLWGGDEMTLVVPAWNGFALLQSFFEASATWQLPLDQQSSQQTSGKKSASKKGSNKQGKPIRLTHSAGIVFCSAKTPIAIIQKWARELAEDLKCAANEIEPNSGDYRQNMWNYMVLESIDYPVGGDVAHFMRHRYGQHLAQTRPRYLSPCANWLSVRQELTCLMEGELLSRRQLYRIAQTLDQHPNPSLNTDSPNTNANNRPCQAPWEALDASELATAQECAEQRLFLLLAHEKRVCLKDKLIYLAEEVFGLDFNDRHQRAWFWLHMIELWDYLVPQCTENNDQQNQTTPSQEVAV